MASDIPLLFAAMFIVAAGIGAVALMLPAARRRQALRSEASTRRRWASRCANCWIWRAASGPVTG